MTSDAAGHLAGLAGFLKVVTGVDMISELYGDSTATLVYDLHTATPVGTQRTAEHLRLQDGRIALITLILDATLWRPIMAQTRPPRNAEGCRARLPVAHHRQNRVDPPARA